MTERRERIPLITRRDIPFLAYALLTLVQRVLPRSLRLVLYEHLGPWLGSLWYRVARADAELTRQNLRAVMGDRLTPTQVEEVARQLFQNIARSKLTNDILPAMTHAEINQLIQIEGMGHLDRVLEQGRGVVLLGVHFGNQGYAPLMHMKHLGYRVTAVLGEEIEPDDSRVYRRLVHPVRRRTRHHLDVIAPTGTPQRVMVDCLRRGDILMIMGDVLEDDMLDMVDPQVLTAPLLGRTVLLKTGPFRLARWVGAPIMPLFYVPNYHGARLVIEPELPVTEDASGNGLASDLAAFTARFEPYLLRYPELWLHWRHERLLDFMRPVQPVELPPQMKHTPVSTGQMK